MCITFSKRSKFQYKTNTRNWNLNDNTLKDTNEWIHLGLNQNKLTNSTFDIGETVDKIRRTYFGIAECGAHDQYCCPTVSVKLYKSIVLPRCLYGSELWNSLSKTEICKLEVIHRYCVKRIQGFHIRTRTDIALGMLESMIDQRKLTFLGIMCRLVNNSSAKYLFMYRLSYAMNFLNNNMTGFFPDIIRILHKYNLFEYIKNYANGAVFPSKHLWKQLTKNAVFNLYRSNWTLRVQHDQLLSRYSYLQPCSDMGIHEP